MIHLVQSSEQMQKEIEQLRQINQVQFLTIKQLSEKIEQLTASEQHLQKLLFSRAVLLGKHEK